LKKEKVRVEVLLATSIAGKAICLKNRENKDQKLTNPEGQKVT